ncbi:MAG: hypothetical protein IIA88_11290 [Bacteroidetes bacterium]|nr:hypothetical protein [Bacteroidota bacterium]
MDKETTDKILKAELQLFQIYSFFLIGLVTGIATILINNEHYEGIILIILNTGIVFSFILGGFLLHTFIKIRKLIKILKN